MEPDRSLQAILFTDIVDSTARAAKLGDRAWRALLRRHHALVRRELDLHRGREAGTAGDGFVATFGKPSEGILCACAIREGVRKLGLEIRSGVHMGSVEWEEETVGGIAVHIGARVAAAAGPGEVLVSQTVRDLETGSGFEFEDRGVQGLKGVPGEWRLFAVTGCPTGAPAVARRRWLRHATRGHGILWGVMAFLMLYSLAGLYVGMREERIRDQGRDRFAGAGPGPQPAGPQGAGAGRIRAPAPGEQQIGAPESTAAPAAAPDTAAGLETAATPVGPPPSTAAAAGGAAGAGATEPTPPEPPPSAPPPQTEPGRLAYESVLRTVERARRAARDAGPRATGSEAYRSGESRRGEAAAAARAGRYEEAEKSLRRAARDYESALATSGLLAQLDAVKDTLGTLRAAADPGSEGVAESQRLEREAGVAEREGRYEEALADLKRAAAAYRASLVTAGGDRAGTPAAPAPPSAAPAPPSADAAPASGGRAGAPPAPPAEPAEAPPEAVVENVLGEMRRAIEAEDLGALRRAWVALGSREAESFERWFAGVREIRVRYDVRSVEWVGDRLVATVEARHEAFNESTNRREAESFRQVLQLERRDGRWVVVASG